MKYLHIEYKNKDIAVFDFDGNYKPREAEAVATIAAALLEEKKRLDMPRRTRLHGRAL